jgi:hypothetical protein
MSRAVWMLLKIGSILLPLGWRSGRASPGRPGAGGHNLFARSDITFVSCVQVSRAVVGRDVAQDQIYPACGVARVGRATPARAVSKE